MDNETKILSVALALMLLSFPLTSIGTENDLTAVWVAGLMALAVGAAAAPILRYVSVDDEPDDSREDN
ncbi:MAG: hypothetical protein ACK4V6_11645 [Microthrixaceae bacterium]